MGRAFRTVLCALVLGLVGPGCDESSRRPEGYYAPPHFDDVAAPAPLPSPDPDPISLSGVDAASPAPEEGAPSPSAPVNPGSLPDFVALVRQVEPSVVNLYADVPTGRIDARTGRRELSETVGSGVILTDTGEVLTNHHVIENALSIRARLFDGRRLRARVLGSDPETDLALLKLETQEADFVSAPLGDSEALQPGDWVLAVGNPYGLEHSVTRGIVSAKGRRELQGEQGYVDFLQTDAAINPGNSGGPLFDLTGEVVGINAAVSGEGQGIAFAIPAETALQVVAELRLSGGVERGWLGAIVTAPEEGQTGLRVRDVVRGSPAELAGLLPGDRLEALDGEALESAFDLRRRVAERGPGARVVLTIRRGNELRQTSVELTAPRRDEG